MSTSFSRGVAIFLLCLFIGQARTDPVEDKQALLDFVKAMPHGRELNWDADSTVCIDWVGVLCSADMSKVIALRLPAIGLSGPFPRNTLSRLSGLQTLSLRSNSISGPFPIDLLSLTSLETLYLQTNNFSGPLPTDFSTWAKLSLLNLANNNFTGPIPSSLSKLTTLVGLSLQNNSLTGIIPDLNLANLQSLNLSNNHLNGNVPPSLMGFPNSSFSGNNLSFGNPPTSLTLPSPMPKRLGSTTILILAVAACTTVFFLACLLLLLVWRRKGHSFDAEKVIVKKVEKEGRKDEDYQGENNKLVFFEGISMNFDLEDLLRASAEVLGKGTFGTAYKAILEDGTSVVVKRLKEVAVGKKEFEQFMEAVGKIRHENVVPLRAYYYSKDEKLLVYDYLSRGSLALLLHGRKGSDKSPLSWDTRVRIALGTSKGLARIHEESGGKFIHADIKSSNVFLNSQCFGCISDMGLSTLMDPVSISHSRSTGYRAPEVIEMKKPTQKSDVYSLACYYWSS